MPIHVELVTQERKVFDEPEADMVLLPASEGEMGVLPHHAPVLTTLGFGELVIRKGGAEERFVIYGGVVDVRLGSWSSGTPNNLIRYLKGSMARNLYNPFHGPVTDHEGIVRIPAHSDAAPADIIKMRYIVEGVEIIE